MVVSKVIPNPEKSTPVETRVYTLSRYVLGMDIDPDVEKCLASVAHGFVSPEPAFQIYEMQVASRGAKKSPDPIKHWVLSWPCDAGPNAEQFNEIVGDYIDFFALNAHQIFAGLHQDTDNQHLHIVLNRFDLAAQRLLGINNGFTRHAGAMFCAFLEDKYGYEPSPNAAAYKVNDELVLSDIYRRDSGGSHIKGNSIKFGAASFAEQLRHNVKALVDRSRSWKQYQHGLFEKGIRLTPGTKGGLVYLTTDDHGVQHAVACSRVYHLASKSKLDAKLTGTFIEDYQPTLSGKLRDHLRMPSIPHFSAQRRDPESEYGRHSSRTAPRKEDLAHVRNVFHALEPVFSEARILFSLPSRGGWQRLHLLDRRRGDSSPLTFAELLTFDKNVAGLMKKDSTVRLLPSLSGDAVMLAGPAAAVARLHKAGLFPRVSMLEESRAQFLFMDLPRDSASSEKKYLRRHALDLGLQEMPHAELTLCEAGTGPGRLVIAGQDLPADAGSLIAPYRLQFIGELEDRLAHLNRLVAGLVVGLRVLIHRAVLWRDADKYLTEERRKGNLDVEETLTRGEQGQRISGAAGPVARGVRTVDQHDERAAFGEGERRNGVSAGEAAVDRRPGILGPEARSGSGDRTGRSDKQRAAGIEDFSGPVSEGHAGDSGSIGEDRGKPVAPVSGTRSGSANARVGGIARRRFWCLRVAKVHGLHADLGRAVDDRIAIFSDDGKKNCVVTKKKIIVAPTIGELSGKSSDDFPPWLRDLTAKLELSPRSGKKAKLPPAAPVLATETAPEPVQPPPRQAVWDLFQQGAAADALPASSHELTLNWSSKLDDYDLSALELLTISVPQLLAPNLPSEIQAVVKAVGRAAGHEAFDRVVRIPSDAVKYEPRVIVLVFDPPQSLAESTVAHSADVLLVPVGMDGGPRFPDGLSLDALECVVLHRETAENLPEDADDPEREVCQNALTTCFQPPFAPACPEFISSTGLLEDEPWRQLLKRTDEHDLEM